MIEDFDLFVCAKPSQLFWHCDVRDSFEMIAALVGKETRHPQTLIQRYFNLAEKSRNVLEPVGNDATSRTQEQITVPVCRAKARGLQEHGVGTSRCLLPEASRQGHPRGICTESQHES